jgi:cytochrome c peroxidase
LTAGIPGEGPLAASDIQVWLARDENHVPLEVELPFGLSAGASQIQGIAENPLTRAKIELGRQLYFDKRLSADNTISCASCHDPQEGFSKHTQVGIGVLGLKGNRNSPISYNRILSGAQFWDGRAASLEEQAVGPIANPIEMGNSHEDVVKTVAGIDGYRIQFETIFPDEGVTIETIGKAIASFERAIVTGPSPADYFEIVRTVEAQFDADEIADLQEDDPQAYEKYRKAVEGSRSMSQSAKRGRELFFTDKANCTACHVGANFSDEKYHNLGVGMDKEKPDPGRYQVTKDEKDFGAFKTPTIRNVALSAPYMHDGSQATLAEVVEWYDKGGHPNSHLSDKIKKLGLNEQEKRDLVAYMEALTGEFPPLETGRLPR